MSRRMPHAAKLATLATALLAAAPTAALAAEPGATAQAARPQLTGTVLTAAGAVSGATVRLYAAGANGARRLAAATTGADGSWSLAYDRPRRGAVLYAIATGGAVGGDALDRRVRLLAVAGSSGSLPRTTLTLEERSTVAGGYALARFIRGSVVSGPEPGLPNAAAMAANLYEPSAGKVSFVLSNSPNGNATESLPTFNTLANALAACTTGGARGCDALLAAARPAGGRRPADTLAAVVAIAHNPSQGTSAIFRLGRRAAQGAGRSAYVPALRKAPAAWTIAVVFTGSGLNAPGRAAFDAQGRQWIVNNFKTPGTTPGRYLTVLDGAGLPSRLGQLGALSGGGVEGSGWGVAVDQRGRTWVANFAGNSLSAFDAQGRALSPRGGWTKGGFSRPQGVAVDRRGNVWVANFGNDSVTLLPGGDHRRARSITGGGIFKPFAIQADDRGHVWVTNGAESGRPGSVTELLPDGTPSAQSPITGGGLRSPQGLALDSRSNKWVANLADRTVTRLLPDGRLAPESPLRLASVRGGWGIAVDGADHVWVADFLGGAVTELCGVRAATCPPGARRAGAPISPRRSGYVNRGFEHITGIQIDQAGNVWLANNWTKGSPFSQFVGGNGVVALVGAAEPVAAPLIGLPRAP